MNRDRKTIYKTIQQRPALIVFLHLFLLLTRLISSFGFMHRNVLTFRTMKALKMEYLHKLNT